MRKFVFGLILLVGVVGGATYALAGGDPEPVCVEGVPCEAWRVDWRLGPPLSDQYQPSKLVGEVFLGPTSSNSSSANRNGAIDIYAFNWGAAQESTAPGGGGGAGRPSLKDFTFVKALDALSPALARLCVTGIHLPSAVVRIDVPQGTMVYDFEDVQCTLDKHGGTGGPTTFPLEEFTFSYRAANLQFDPSGKNRQ